MKQLLLVAVLSGVSVADDCDWEVQSFGRTDSDSWTFTFRNSSEKAIEVWSVGDKREAVANLYQMVTGGLFGAMGMGRKLLAEPCHPNSLVTVEPGGTIRATLPAVDGIVKGEVRVAIVIDRQPVILDSIESLIKKSQQAGAVQPATRSESDSEGGDKPQPESEGRSR